MTQSHALFASYFIPASTPESSKLSWLSQTLAHPCTAFLRPPQRVTDFPTKIFKTRSLPRKLSKVTRHASLNGRFSVLGEILSNVVDRVQINLLSNTQDRLHFSPKHKATNKKLKTFQRWDPCCFSLFLQPEGGVEGRSTGRGPRERFYCFKIFFTSSLSPLGYQHIPGPVVSTCFHLLSPKMTNHFHQTVLLCATKFKKFKAHTGPAALLTAKYLSLTLGRW